MSSNKTNLFDPSNILAQFSFDDDKEDIYKFFIKSVTLPEIQFGVTNIYKNGKMIYLKGNSIDEGSITMNLLLDEELRVYTDLLDLNYKYYRENKNVDVLQVFVYNNQNQPKLRFDFYDIFFSNISSPILDIDSKETENLIPIIINYKRFEYFRYQY